MLITQRQTLSHAHREGTLLYEWDRQDDQSLRFGHAQDKGTELELHDNMTVSGSKCYEKM